MKVSVRRARLDEAAKLTDLSMRSKRSNGYDDAFMEACREELTVTAERMTEGEFWVTEADAICGCACLLANVDQETGEVHAFFIDPTSQGKGIGRLLWAQIIKRAREKGLSTLHLDADPFAVPFYQAMGCRITGNEPSGSIPGRMLPKMEITLT